MKIKKIFLFLGITLFCQVSMMAQTDSVASDSDWKPLPPDYEWMKAAVSDKSSQYYYPKLKKRFLKADTTLDIQDLRCLYYGYPFQPDFSPYRAIDELDEVRNMLQADTMTHADWIKVVELAEKGLTRKPSDIIMCWYKIMGCYYAYGDEDALTDKARLQLNMLMAAISSSGDASAQYPIYLTSVMQSYFIMDMEGVRPKHQALVYIDKKICDAFPLEENEFGLDTLYFEIGICIKYWDNNFQKNETTTDLKKVRSVEIPLGSHFLLKPTKLKNNNSRFDVIVLEDWNEPLSMNDSTLFSTKRTPGIIEGYFGQEAADSAELTKHVLLITKGSDGDLLDFDTEIRGQYSRIWEKTTNHGVFGTAKGVEIWSSGYDAIRISNIRKKK